MKKYIVLLLIWILFFAIYNAKNENNLVAKNKSIKTRELVLLATREASPIGFASLEMYSDSTFKFTNGALRLNDTFVGKYILKKDTFYLSYKNSSTYFLGQKLIKQSNTIQNRDTNYNVSLHIYKNKLISKNDSLHIKDAK